MSKYEKIKADMILALKERNKARRLVLADIVATIDKTATAGKSRVEITDDFVNTVLAKYRKTVQEMIDTCPNTEQYADKKAEYIANMAIVEEYAPKLIDDKEVILEMAKDLCVANNIEISNANKGIIMKTIMPALKVRNCDMKVAQKAILTLMEG